MLTEEQYDKFVFSSAAVFGMLADLQLEEPVPGTKLMNTERYSTAYEAFPPVLTYAYTSHTARLPSTGATSSASSR
jgi:hypothetical protein